MKKFTDKNGDQHTNPNNKGFYEIDVWIDAKCIAVILRLFFSDKNAVNQTNNTGVECPEGEDTDSLGDQLQTVRQTYCHRCHHNKKETARWFQIKIPCNIVYNSRQNAKRQRRNPEIKAYCQTNAVRNNHPKGADKHLHHCFDKATVAGNIDDDQPGKTCCERRSDIAQDVAEYQWDANCQSREKRNVPASGRRFQFEKR